jgi:hypothetical protein
VVKRWLARFLYVASQATDSVIPMTIDPVPAQIVRVVVCHVEIITPEMVDAKSGSKSQPRK